MFAVFGIALVGGLILNIMPCVLPVLTLKAFHVIHQANESAATRRTHGAAYTFGTVSFFLALSAIVIVLKGLGRHLQWGMQFQHPPFVAFTCAVVFAFALNALGVYEINMSSGGETGDESKLSGSVVNGWFAALMSTPCSAPFLGSAIGVALDSQTTTIETIGIFACIGLGLALPYLLITLVPSVGKILPKPGAWMETFKHLMGFTLLGAAVWLFRTLQEQVTSGSSNDFLIFLLLLGVALWAIPRFGGLAESRMRRYGVRIAVVASLIILGKFVLVFEKPVSAATTAPVVLAANDPMGSATKPALEPEVLNGKVNWTLYNADLVKQEWARNRPVFLDFTAAWCASCQTNDHAFIETDTVRNAFTRTHVRPIRCDMTNESDELDALLDKYLGPVKRNGIPAYIIAYPDGTFTLLPVTITADMVSNALDEAAKKYPADKYAMAGPKG